MDPCATAWLAKLRAEAEVPGTIIVCTGRLRLLPEDIVGKSDVELHAYVCGLLEEHRKAAHAAIPEIPGLRRAGAAREA